VRAQDIADEILSSERLMNSQAFADRVYTDEPILRTGTQVLEQRKHASLRPRVETRVQRHAMPAQYRHMRDIARSASTYDRMYTYGASGSRIFYEQGKYMEDFEDDFEGKSELYRFCGTYEDLGDYDLRCYFTWRSQFRSGSTTYAPLSFLYIYAHEIICGIGVEQGAQGFATLRRLSQEYAGISASFDSHLTRWMHDYVIYHDLDKTLIANSLETSFSSRVALLAKAQNTLVAHDLTVWPAASVENLPTAQDILDAHCALSRYRADRSRFIREHRDDVAEVCSRVFAKMVWHCHKRRKIDYIDGLFGGPVRNSYTMYPSAIFWTSTPHPDAEYALSDAESYLCERGFWWRRVPCRRFDTSKELGALMHAIDCRMRVAMGDAHELKARPLPKYQGKFVDEEIAALLERRKAEEAARIHIDRSSLVGIRSASMRTREALLTDEEREDDEPVAAVAEVVTPVECTRDAATGSNGTTDASIGQSQGVMGLDARQASLLQALLLGDALTGWNDLEISLAVDAINEAFLDTLGDTVIEFDGDVPCIVEDYEQDVRDALA